MEVAWKSVLGFQAGCFFCLSRGHGCACLFQFVPQTTRTRLLRTRNIVSANESSRLTAQTTAVSDADRGLTVSSFDLTIHHLAEPPFQNAAAPLPARVPTAQASQPTREGSQAPLAILNLPPSETRGRVPVWTHALQNPAAIRIQAICPLAPATDGAVTGRLEPRATAGQYQNFDEAGGFGRPGPLKPPRASRSSQG